ncbi:MAG: glutamine-hydrolyzing carbamoyl-phosphate synthase small subunit [Pseudomonadota bacterium]
MTSSPQPWTTEKPTAVIVLADGTVIEGKGCGATGIAEAEICFNTAITGYQEILTDPSYAGQVVTFTFPHIGNVGTNEEDLETLNPEEVSAAVGAVFKADITSPSNYRSAGHLNDWLVARNIIAMSGIDTRALTNLIREKGLANCVIAHSTDGNFDIEDLKSRATKWSGLEGLDLAKEVGHGQDKPWSEAPWVWNEGYSGNETPEYHVVAIDFGVKRNILRLLAGLGCKVTIMPANATAEDVLSHNPDGIFLSNGPGDPAATGEYSVTTIQKLLETDLPIFGICLGHQMLALALGAKTKKMHQGHHGANHPVKDYTTNKVEIVSMNHGFAVDADTFPDGVKETHVSLFDGSNCGLAVENRPVFSVQHHPEASPGPQDSHYLFTRFINLIKAKKGEELAAER